jgi:hypothetical protein
MRFRRWPISCSRMFPSYLKAQYTLEDILGKWLI